MTRPTIVEYWAALRAGDPDTMDALTLARADCLEQEAMLARTIRAEVRAEAEQARANHLAAIIRGATNALRRDNPTGALHQLEQADKETHR